MPKIWILPIQVSAICNTWWIIASIIGLYQMTAAHHLIVELAVCNADTLFQPAKYSPPLPPPTLAVRCYAVLFCVYSCIRCILRSTNVQFAILLVWLGAVYWKYRLLLLQRDCITVGVQRVTKRRSLVGMGGLVENISSVKITQITMHNTGTEDFWLLDTFLATRIRACADFGGHFEW